LKLWISLASADLSLQDCSSEPPRAPLASHPRVSGPENLPRVLSVRMTTTCPNKA